MIAAEQLYLGDILVKDSSQVLRRPREDECVRISANSFPYNYVPVIPIAGICLYQCGKGSIVHYYQTIME